MGKQLVQGAGGGCFHADTKVATPNGDKRIAGIKVGDVVYSFNDIGEITERKVTKLFTHENEPLYRVDFWGGSFKITDNHWVLNQYYSFVEVGTLTSEDCLVDHFNHLRPVKSITYLENTTVYNLAVEGEHTFIADGIRVHNGGKGTVKTISGAGGGGKSSGGSSRAPVEDPDSLRSTQYARVLDLISEGEIEGLVNGDKSIYFDDTPLQNADDSYNFVDVTINTRNGTQAQTYIQGFPNIESEVPVSVEVTNAVSVTRQLTDSNLDICRVTISTPRLTYQDTTTGDLKGTSVNYAIDLQADGGGFVEVLNTNFNGKTTTRYRRSHDIELTGNPPWDIRVRRITADSEASNLVNTTWWDSYTQVIDQKLSYPNSALIGVQIDASQFNNIPKRAYDCKLIKVKIPSNYNPLTRVYTGIWNGTFTTAWTDNPAWCFYDLLITERYGLGAFIDAALTDKWTLYEIGQYCDELVPDGFGGTEPRFTCNIYMQTRNKALSVVKDMASIFRGMVYWSSNGITPVQDSPSDVLAQFTNADVLEGVFNYQGSASKTRHTVALISWNDPLDRYKQKVEYVEDQDNIAKFGINETELAAAGCTSRGQAHRVGKWLLFSENTETEAVTFQTSLEGTSIFPGSIIRTLDQFRAGIRHGGRVISSTSTTITIDNAITIASGIIYTISCTLPDGTIIDKTITNAVGSHTVLTIDSSFATQPLDYAIWVVTSSEVSPELWRIISVTEDEPNIFSVNAIEHNASKYDFVEDNLTLEVLPSTVLENTCGVVTDVTVDETLYEVNPGTFGTKIHLGWAPSNEAIKFKVMYKRDNENYITISDIKDSQIEVYDEGYGEFTFKIIAYNALNVNSPTVTYEKTILGVTEPPSDMTGFAVNIVGDTAYLSWDAVTNLDLSHYVIKFSTATTGATWGSSIPLIAKISKTATSITAPAMTGTYLIKAVDFADPPVESVNAALIINTASLLDNLNVVETITEHPTFSGTHSGTEANAGILRLASDTIDTWTTLDAVSSMYYGIGGISSSGVYGFNGTIDLGDVFTSRVTANINAYGSNIADFIASWDTLSSVENMSGSDPSLWSVLLEARTTPDDTAGSPTWTSWFPLLVGDYTARGMEFRITLNAFSSDISPFIDALSITVDMEDRVHGEYDLVCTTGGLSVVYDPAFNALPAIGISAQGLQTGDYYVMTSKSATGFTIAFKNSIDAAIQRTFDYVAKGYGYVN